MDRTSPRRSVTQIHNRRRIERAGCCLARWRSCGVDVVRPAGGYHSRHVEGMWGREIALTPQERERRYRAKLHHRRFFLWFDGS
jgi:hypothetical protein